VFARIKNISNLALIGTAWFLIGCSGNNDGDATEMPAPPIADVTAPIVSFSPATLTLPQAIILASPVGLTSHVQMGEILM